MLCNLTTIRILKQRLKLYKLHTANTVNVEIFCIPQVCKQGVHCSSENSLPNLVEQPPYSYIIHNDSIVVIQNWLKKSICYRRTSENSSWPSLSLIPQACLSSTWRARGEEGIKNKIYCMQRSSVISNACDKRSELQVLTWPPLINVRVPCAHHIYMYFAHYCFQSSSKYFIFQIYSAKTTHRTCLWLRMYPSFCLYTAQGNLKTKHKEN